MKMKLFFATFAMLFSMGIITSCGNKTNAKAETASVEATTKAVDECCKTDTTACKDKAACDTISCCKETVATDATK
ncbi:MAG: hypothetical protein LUH22_20155 [Bacteroides sp.]|nr:hypothetical protein [Bacteroides sp.]